MEEIFCRVKRCTGLKNFISFYFPFSFSFDGKEMQSAQDMFDHTSKLVKSYSLSLSLFVALGIFNFLIGGDSLLKVLRFLALYN